MSHVPGMIYSPTAFKKAADAKAFSTNPGDAGAGPFKVKSYKPGESVELERNPNYYGGEVYLDGLKFVLLTASAARTTRSRRARCRRHLLRDPALYAQSKKDGMLQVDIPQVGGNLMIMNSGIDITCAGAATASRARVRGSGRRHQGADEDAHP